MKLTPITNPVALRLDTTVGTRIFAGDTMIHGDTGWRDIEELLGNGWEKIAYAPRVRRVGDTVELKMYLSRNAATSSTVLTLPSGFRPMGVNVSFTATAPVALNTVPGLVTTSGEVRLKNDSTLWGQNEAYVQATFMAGQWPATLPGLPV